MKKYRTLLSEVLPYETPVFFDNSGFYEKLVSGDINVSFFLNTFKDGEFSIPFNYDVRRNGGSGERRLSIIHPCHQLKIVDFYEKYDELLVKNSVGSPFSLRHINSVAKLEYDTSHELIVDYDKTDREIDDEERDSKVYVTYFAYKEIDRMYKFFKDMPLFRLEQKYPKMRKLDVAKCFYHIYTHSIAWAIEGKAFAKDNKNEKRLSKDFDTLMQQCNYNETNGIVVGPELSRIFAEIIFRRIDFNVLESLKEQDIVFGRDYELRRYVDDIMIFAYNDVALDKIEAVLNHELEEYKLYLNTAKRENYTRPFGTPLSCAKQELLEEYYALQSRIEKSTKQPYRRALDFFRKFRTLASDHNISYGDLNRMTLSLLTRMIKRSAFGKKLQMREDGKEEKVDDLGTKVKSWITVLDIAFFVYSLDMSVTASLRLCRILLLAGQTFENENIEAKTAIEEKMLKEARRCLSIHFNNDSKDLTPIEVVNPMLTLKSLNLNVCTRESLIRLFHLETNGNLEFSHLNYFNICSLLMLIQDDLAYADIKQALMKVVEERYERYGVKWKKNSEMTAHAQ